MTQKWKFLLSGFRSLNGYLPPWEIGVWKKHEKCLHLCYQGFHCSSLIIDAFSYVPGEILAQVETRGMHLADAGKEVWSEMRILRAWEWTRLDSIKLALFIAETVLPVFEARCMAEDRPRETVEWLKSWIAAYSSSSGERDAEEAAIMARTMSFVRAEYHSLWPGPAFNAMMAIWSAINVVLASTPEFAANAAANALGSARLSLMAIKLYPAVFNLRDYPASEVFETWAENRVKELNEV